MSWTDIPKVSRKPESIDAVKSPDFDIDDMIRVVNVDELPSASFGAAAPYQYSNFDGDKFAGGFGATKWFTTDYWTLRRRSAQLFKDNLYARGMIRRLITNEINTGLTLDSQPVHELISTMSEDDAVAWSEDVERRWKVFAADPRICDYQGKHSEGELQRIIRREALIDGDILVVQRFDAMLGMTKTQLINGEFVNTPVGGGKPRSGNRIVHGVELDKDDRHVAYWVQQEGDKKFERLPAIRPGTDMRTAWLVYGTDMRHNEVRGEPLLSIILQSLKEIDRYRDATTRKAVVNSFFAMYVTKEMPQAGSRPLTGGAVRHDQVTADNVDGSATRNLNFSSHLPGVILDELQPGEEPKAFRPDGTDINFEPFEGAIIKAIAWANEMPAEILTLSFGQNFSASQAAVNEFKMYLNSIRANFAGQYCNRRYHQWLFFEILAGRISAPGLLQAWSDKRQYQFVGAWLFADWTGAIKPATDIVKQVKGYDAMVASGFISRQRATKELNGSDFAQNIRQLKRENVQLSEANASLGPSTLGVDTPDGIDDDDDTQNVASNGNE